MDIRDVQTRLKKLGLYDGDVDGMVGSRTKAAVKAFMLQQGVAGHELWLIDRRLVATRQLICRLDGIEVGPIDGLLGPQTKYAIEVWDARQISSGPTAPSVENWRDDSVAPQASSKPLPAISSKHVKAPSVKPVWPRQNAMDSFYGPKGTGQTTLLLPYQMYLAWDLDSPVNRFTCHSKVKESLYRIFARTLDHYGIDEIRRLRLDLFGGCLNVRKMRGGSAWSIHSWGCAVDIDPEHNQLRWNHERASLAREEYDAFWSFVYDEGAISLGRERDYDWMHFQFARL